MTRSMVPRNKESSRKKGKEYTQKMHEYERALDILSERNSYSKTDEDATFMRMKEDAMPGNNIKIEY